MKAYLILGCNGYVDRCGANSDFVYCQSLSNPILDLSKIPMEKKNIVIDFLDNSCGLFDEIQNDRNKISNILSFLYKKYSLIDEDTLHKLQWFINMHKICGIYLTLIAKEDYVCLK